MPHLSHSLVSLDYTAPVVQMRNPQVDDSDIETLGAFLTGALVRAHLAYTVRAICFALWHVASLVKQEWALGNY